MGPGGQFLPHEPCLDVNGGTGPVAEPEGAGGDTPFPGTTFS